MRLIPGDIELKQKQGTRISDLINSFIKQQETRDQIDNRKYKDTRFNRNVGGQIDRHQKTRVYTKIQIISVTGEEKMNKKK